MIKQIQDILSKSEYKFISSNLPFVSMHVKYEDDRAKVIQLIDCENEIKLTVQQFQAFCDKAREYISNKGYSEVEMLSIVVTSKAVEAKKFILSDDKCWIVDTVDDKVLIFDNQPSDFHGLLDELWKCIDEDRLLKENQIDISDEIKDTVPDGNNKRKISVPRSFYDEFTLVNTSLVAFNILVFIITSLLGSTKDVDFMIAHGAMYVPAVINEKQIYRFITCIFLHFGFVHMMGNMVVLLFLGDNVERIIGRYKFLAIYIIGGVIGSIGSFLYALVYNNGIVSAGASGAIFALIGALLWLVIRNKGRIEEMTTLRVCVLIAYALYNGFISENVDMAAHLFGLVSGFLMAMILYRKSSNNS